MNYKILLFFSILLNSALLYCQIDSNWVVEDITSPGYGGGNISLSVINNQPVISYFNLDTNRVTVIQRQSNGQWDELFYSDELPSSVWSSIIVDANGKYNLVYTNSYTGEVKYAGWLSIPPSADLSIIDNSDQNGQYISMDINNNNAIAITYQSASDNSLKYAVQSGGDWNIHTIFSSSSSPKWSSLNFDDQNRPNVTFEDPVTGDIKYIGWLPLPPAANISTIDNTSQTGQYMSMDVDNNNEIGLTYQSAPDNSIKFAKQTGSNWNIQTIFSSTSSPTWSSLIFDNLNRPDVTIGDPAASEVKYLGWLPLPPSADIEIVDNSDNVGQNLSISFSESEKPFISYYDAANQDLKFSYKIGLNWINETVDYSGNVGNVSSLISGTNNKVGIAYNDVTNGNVKYAESYILENAGLVKGIVKDATSGDVIPNAKVNVQDFDYSAGTNSLGEFYLLVPFGKGYNIQVTASGYLPFLKNNVYSSLYASTDIGEIKLAFTDETEFDIGELNPNPNPKISSVEQGGILFRYYKIIGKESQAPINGISATFKSVGGLEKTFFSQVYSNENGILVINISADSICTGYNCLSEFKLISINGKEYTGPPVDFEAKVLPRKYQKEYEADLNLNLGLGVAVGAHGSLKAGIETTPKMILKEVNGDPSELDSLELYELTQAKGGVEFGVGVGAKLGASSNTLGAYGGLSGGGYAILEGNANYLYNYSSENNTDEARAKLLNVSKAALTFSSDPILSKVLLYLATLDNWQYLDNAEVGLGLELGGSANATVGLFQQRSIGIGGGFHAQVGAKIGAICNLGYDRPADNIYSRFSVFGQFDIGAGFGIMLWKYKTPGQPKSHGLNKIKQRSGLGGFEGLGWDLAITGGKAEFSIGLGHLGLNPDNWQSIELNTKLESTNKWERDFTLQFSPTDLKGLMTKSLQSLYNLSDKNYVNNIELPKLDKNYLSNTLDDFFINVFDDQLKNILPPIDYKIDSAKVIASGGFTLNIDWEIALKVTLDEVGLNWRTLNKANIERGVFLGLLDYPLEKYSTIPEIQTTPSEALKMIFQEGFATFNLSDLFHSICLFCNGNNSSIAKVSSVKGTNIYVISENGSTLALDPATLPTGLDSLSCQTWNWYGNSTTAKLSDLSLKKRKIALAIKEQQQELAKMDYGIGGFYKFSPQPVPLSSPAALTIVYPDSDVTGIYESNLAVFYQDTTEHQWKYLGGVVDSVNNKITVSVDTLQLFTIAPIMPGGDFGLNIDKDTLINEGSSIANVISDTLKLANGMNVGNNQLYTILAENLTIEALDADTTIEGTQVRSQNSVIGFQVKSQTNPGKAVVRVESVYGSSKGQADLTVIDTTAPDAPVITKLLSGDSEIKLVVTNPDTAQVSQYEVYYDLDSGEPYKGEALVGGENSPYTVAASDTITAARLKNDSTYYFSIKAIDGGGNKSRYSNEVMGIPKDTVSPGRIEVMDFTVMPDSSYLVRWIASGDNGAEGQAYKYTVKLSNAKITDTTQWWQNAMVLDNITAPGYSGNFDYCIIKDIQLDTNYSIGIQVEDESGNKSGISIFRAEQSRATRTTSINKGWNLLSLSVLKELGNWSSYYPSLSSGPYTYGSTGYINSDTINKFQGFWVRINDKYNINKNGTVIKDTVIDVKEGWNLIGSNSYIEQTSSIQTSPEGIIVSPFYSYDSTGYNSSAEIRYGKGYWIKVSQDGQLILSTSGRVIPKKSNGLMNGEGFNIITSNKIEKQLWLVSSDKVKLYEAPPYPPEEILDIRFGNNGYAADEKDDVYKVSLKWARYPVEIEGNNIGDDKYKIVGEITGQNYGILTAGNKIVVENAKDTRIDISRQSIPTEFYLNQNYPNPFNPATTIQFGLPAKEKVKIIVYDILGRQVEVLKNDEQMEAGRYKITWNAVNYASGVYFLSLKAGNYKSVKKMLLVK